MGWLFGFELHLIINDKGGEILYFMFTLGNVNDRKPLKQGRFLENIKRKLCADKGYIGQVSFESLFLDGIKLVTKVKNNIRNSLMSIADKILLKKRALIETVNDELKTQHRQSTPDIVLLTTSLLILCQPLLHTVSLKRNPLLMSFLSMTGNWLFSNFNVSSK